MPANRRYPEGTRLRCTGYRCGESGGSTGSVAEVFISPRFGYGVRFEDYDYGDEDDPQDQHSFEDHTWEPVGPKDRPVKGICKFLRKLEEKAS
jgi:hypothetical protein